MTPWNQLLITLDETLGFPNKKSSKVKKIKQAYDNNTNEHVIWLEYRVRVSNDVAPKPEPQQQIAQEERRMKFLRQLSGYLNEIKPKNK